VSSEQKAVGYEKHIVIRIESLMLQIQKISYFDIALQAETIINPEENANPLNHICQLNLSARIQIYPKEPGFSRCEQAAAHCSGGVAVRTLERLPLAFDMFQLEFLERFGRHASGLTACMKTFD
jgi:hypothetical protein